MGVDRMSEKRYLARSTAIAARALGDEMMIMSATNSTLFTLNEAAKVIWDAADGATPLEEIVTDKICAQFDVAPEIALKDAQGLVEVMAEHGLLLLSDQPILPPAGLPGGNP
jgi:galactose mutarotase-like enzyme